MQEQKGRDLLIRGIPFEVYALLDTSAKNHHRSRNQEAIVILADGLNKQKRQIKRPTPFVWKKKITSQFVNKAINEGRE